MQKCKSFLDRIPGRSLVPVARSAYYRMRGHCPFTFRGIRFKCDPDHMGFWKSMGMNEFEPETYDIFDAFLKSDSTYCDIGAWIGPTVIYAAKKCKQAICFEPNPESFRYLIWNLCLNGLLDNVTPYQIALANSDGLVKMSQQGTASMSMGILEEARTAHTIDVLGLTWKTWGQLVQAPHFDFIKIDIEGLEFSFLPQLRQAFEMYAPTVYLSTHAPYLPADQRKGEMNSLIDVLGGYRYCLDERMKPIPIQSLLEDSALNHWRGFVFTNRPVL